jgi:hypothetical protein
MIPFYAMPMDEKLAIIRQQLADNSIIALEPEGWLPEGWGIILRMVYGVVLASFQVKMLVNWRKKKFRKIDTSKPGNVQVVNWIYHAGIVEFYYTLNRIRISNFLFL